MNRMERLQQYQQEAQGLMADFYLKFAKRINDKPHVLTDLVHTLLAEAEKSRIAQEKAEVVYFYFSLLQVDLLRHHFRVALQVFDDSWYLDDHPIELDRSVDGLLEDFVELEHRLMLCAEKHQDVIHQYDIQSSFLETVKPLNYLITWQLRHTLQALDLESDFWKVAWGEYEGDAAMLVQKDLRPKESSDWEQSLRKTENHPDYLSVSYWYGLNLTDNSCASKQMDFICFDTCQLEGVCFDQCNLYGARFKQTVLKNCSFKGADLTNVNFTEAVFEGVNAFDDANMSDTMFRFTDALKHRFSEEQKDTILVSTEAKGREG